MKQLVDILDRYNLPWLLLAVLAWSAVLLLCNRKQILRALPVGFWTMIVGSLLEQFFVGHRFWEDHFVLIHVGKMDFFLIIGPFFVIGLLLAAFLPEKGLLIVLALLFWSAIATGIELLANFLHFLSYAPGKWGAGLSFLAYFFGLSGGIGFYFIWYRHRFKLP